MAIYVKKHRYFREVRVAEVIGSFEKKNLDQIRNVIVHYAFKNRCFLITTADKFLFGLRLYGKFGPKLTFRPLTEDVDFNDKALNIQNWHYSLGDLELF